MNADREVAQIYARQAERAGRAAIVVVGGGGIGSLAGAGVAAAMVTYPNRAFVFLGVLGIGVALTAVLYAVTSALQSHAEVGAARHLGAALDDEEDRERT